MRGSLGDELKKLKNKISKLLELKLKVGCGNNFCCRIGLAAEYFCHSLSNDSEEISVFDYSNDGGLKDSIYNESISNTQCIDLTDNNRGMLHFSRSLPD